MLKKLLTAGVMLALVAAVGFAAIPTSAQSVTCANIDSLLTIMGVTGASNIAAAKAAVGCGVTAPAAAFTRNLTVGSTGADVTALQTMLGVTPATGYFGAITKAAVMAYQTANGISATGYVGPLTLAKLNYVAPVVVAPVVAPVVTPVVSNLAGTDGSIADVSKLASYNNEEVGEGQNAVKVLGMDVEASKDGDIQLKSIKLTLTENGTGDSNNLNDYVDAVSILLGSTEVGSVDVSDFNEDSNGVYSKTITLSNVIVKADSVAKLYVAVDAVNTFDSGDIDGLDWSVDVSNIRYMDGSGVTTTDTDSGDLPGGADGFNVPVDFVSFSTAANTEFKASLDSSSPVAQVVAVDNTDTTDGVVLLKGKFKLDGTSDVVLNELPITFTSNEQVSTTTGSVTLTIDGQEFTESVPAAATSTYIIVFNNLDLSISAGETVNFTVSADIEDTDGALDNGDTLLASVTADNMDALDIENEDGDQLATADTTGTSIGEAQAFYDEGIKVTLSGSPTMTKTSGTITGDSDVAVAIIKVKVEAFGDTMYVAELTSTATGTPHLITSADADVTVDVVDLDTSADLVGDGYEVVEGTPETFTFTVTMSTGSTTSQTARAAITSIAWDSVSTTGADANAYTFNLDDFKSPSTTILQH